MAEAEQALKMQGSPQVDHVMVEACQHLTSGKMVALAAELVWVLRTIMGTLSGAMVQMGVGPAIPQRGYTRVPLFLKRPCGDRDT